ncbi:Wadjet anti-phage system protein JetD domain-containing protein [Oceanospirillum beijerinckii]|uniref:Wadjet anti-phage system protein JetD domain-containing protein n=1 Tax=Oceanospirillum beijerinckii TaxID=64976 RepID=UPI0003FC979D|nr:Wadjet anti-phage system protein JetD domain-containing protein [Oceanospirillum beijerinckii]
MGKKTSQASRWGDKQSLLIQVQKLWDKGCLLQETLASSELFPKRLIFKTPSSQALVEEFDLVRDWLAQIKQLTGFRVEYKTIQHRVMGQHNLPCEVWLDDLDTAIKLLGEQKNQARFIRQYRQTQAQLPELEPWLYQHAIKALSYADVWPQLLDFILWRQQHPDSAIYLRQVSLPGIDTKLIEQHKGILTTLLDLVLPETQVNTALSSSKRFAERYGFQSKPEMIRFRLLDQHSSILPGINGDITLTAADFNALQHQPGFFQQLQHIFITENEINFLTFPAYPNALVIFGAGYGFSAFDQVNWLAQMQIFYWGDIDVDGFAILNQLRHKLPQVHSLMMDEGTLLAHQTFWGTDEKARHKSQPQLLDRLTDREQSLYQALLDQRYQEALRLEQERIQFDYVNHVLQRLAVPESPL